MGKARLANIEGEQCISPKNPGGSDMENVEGSESGALRVKLTEAVSFRIEVVRRRSKPSRRAASKAVKDSRSSAAVMSRPARCARKCVFSLKNRKTGTKDRTKIVRLPPFPGSRAVLVEGEERDQKTGVGITNHDLPRSRKSVLIRSRNFSPGLGPNRSANALRTAVEGVRLRAGRGDFVLASDFIAVPIILPGSAFFSRQPFTACFTGPTTARPESPPPVSSTLTYAC